MITLDGAIVHHEQDDTRTTHTCATRRVAEVLATKLELESAGWVSSSGLSSSDNPRRPLLLPSEHMGLPLDGTRSDERAQGFTARRGDDWLVVDACAGMAPRVVDERGDTVEARQIVERYLGALTEVVRS